MRKNRGDKDEGIEFTFKMRDLDTIFISRCSLKEYRFKGQENHMLVLAPVEGKRDLVISPLEFELFFYEKGHPDSGLIDDEPVATS